MLQYTYKCKFTLRDALLLAREGTPVERSMKELLVGVRDAAAALGLSHWTVRQYIRDGKIQAVRLGRRVLVEPSELENLVAVARAEAQDGES